MPAMTTKIYPVWKHYMPERVEGGLRFAEGTYKIVNAQWYRLEAGTVQEFINQVHQKHRPENQRRQPFVISPDWTWLDLDVGEDDE